MSAMPAAPERSIGASATLRDHDRTRVLLIAGNTHATETLVELLDALGYQVQTAAKGTATRLQHAPEIVIADVCLPEGGAWEVLHSLRRQSGWAGVPAIALGRFDPIHTDRAEAAGFLAVLPKPISIWALHRAIQNALSRRSAHAFRSR